MNIDILANDIVSIRELDFIGRAAFSPDGRFSVAYADSYRTPDGILHGGGFRNSGSGRVILFENGGVVWQREIPRPTRVVVTARGHVLIADLAFGFGLQSTIHIVDVNGQTVVQQNLRALLADCAATDDQKFAVFTSHGSETDADSSKLFVYSLETGAMLFKSQSYAANIEACVVSDSELTVLGDGLTCRYSIRGEILNADDIDLQLFQRALKAGYLPTAFFCLERKSKPLPRDSDIRQKLATGFLKLSETGLDIKYRAKCFRYLGEIALCEGNKSDALKHFRTALSFNPKIGLKQRVIDLE